MRPSLYVGVVEKPLPLPLTGEQYGKMEPKCPKGGHCQSVLYPQGVFNVPLYFKLDYDHVSFTFILLRVNWSTILFPNIMKTEKNI